MTRRCRECGEKRERRYLRSDGRCVVCIVGAELDTDRDRRRRARERAVYFQGLRDGLKAFDRDPRAPET